jgi:hypothetical protein
VPDFDLPPVYEVGPEYLLREDGKLPKQFEAELELVSTLRLNGILNFAALSWARWIRKAARSLPMRSPSTPTK